MEKSEEKRKLCYNKNQNINMNDNKLAQIRN